MHCTRKITPDIHWVGGNDRRLELFENMFPLPNGVAYHSYLILDEKVALLDTVDSSISGQFFENLEHVLQGRVIDYLIVNHMEPDHCANIEELCRRFPSMKLVGNSKTFQMIRQFYRFDIENLLYEVREGDRLNLGAHTLRFDDAGNLEAPRLAQVPLRPVPGQAGRYAGPTLTITIGDRDVTLWTGNDPGRAVTCRPIGR